MTSMPEGEHVIGTLLREIPDPAAVIDCNGYRGDDRGYGGLF
jgi:hypothetical protein